MITAKSWREQPLVYQTKRWQRGDLLLLILYPLIFVGYFEFFATHTVGRSFLGIYRRPLTIGLYALIAALLLQFIRQKSHKKSIKLSEKKLIIFLMILIFVIYNFIKGKFYLNSYYSNIGETFGLFLLICTASFLANNRMSDLRKYLHILSSSFLLLGIIHSLFLLIEKLGYNTRFWIGEGMMIMPLVFYYFLFHYLFDRQKELKYLIYAFLALLPILLSFEKAIVVPLILSFSLIIIISLYNYLSSKNKDISNIKKTIKRIGALLIVFVFFVSLYYFVFPDDFETYRKIILVSYLKVSPETLDPIGRVDGGRYYIWQTALRLLLEKPIFGYGFGVSILSDLGDYIFPHNILLDILLSFGIVGTLIFVLLIARLIKYMNIFPIHVDYQLENKTILAYLLFIFCFAVIGVIWNKILAIYTLALFLGMLLKIGYLNNNQVLYNKTEI